MKRSQSEMKTDRYRKSQEFLTRALKSIPLGTQTFSKSKTQYPVGVSPLYINRAQGSHVWDVDNHEYVDFVNGLAAITLGYNDPDVTKAVHGQVEGGVIYSLPHPIETVVAEKLVEIIPCAEMVRFGKNGSDATAGAIRLARAVTGKDHVLVCGYHGWQDWYIGSTQRNKGVPKAVQDLTHTFKYNDLDSLQTLFNRYKDNVAAVILEPMNIEYPKEGFLENAKEMTHKNNALFIFDETITGFRFSKGGAQELFGVTPDLATFGKGLANGYPLSAVVGKEKYMREMEEIFFSFTFGGEILSLTAALATIEKMQRESVIEKLSDKGKVLMDGFNKSVKAHHLEKVFKISGHPSWALISIHDTDSFSKYEIETLFLQEMFKRGILILGSHNMSYAHSDEDCEKLLSAYDEVFAVIEKGITGGDIKDSLQCAPLEPLFKVRS